MLDLKHFDILLFFVFLNILVNQVVSANDTEKFSFDGFSAANLTLDGVAKITSNGLLVLTDDTYQDKGHAFIPSPLQFKDYSPSNNGSIKSFSVSFVFAIYSEYPDKGGHGLAFVVAPSKNLSSALPTEYLGLLNMQNNGNNSNRIFAVELDTVLSPDFQDIDNNHVGIDINSLRSLSSHSAGYYDDKSGGALKNLTLISHSPKQVWVEYDGKKMQLNVTLAPLGTPKPNRPLLSVDIDLSSVITDSAYTGFSASTGVIFSHHYLLGWSFNLNGGVAPPLDYSKLPKLPTVIAESTVLDIVLPIATAAFVLSVVAIVIVCARRRLKYAEVREDWEVEFGPHRFCYKDLFHATNGFGDKQLLGTGGFGRVYKGVLRASRMEVAVKRVSHESRQGMKEFVAEVVSIGRMRHRNLVQLLGYCRRKGELLLVYDYMPNGSLDKYLYDQGGAAAKPMLDWEQRFRIIKGVASGLLYLHEDWEQVVIHRDIKASNVLLDAEMNCRLGDFGLAILYDHGADPHTTRVVGTMGYLAPELARTGKVTPVTDVFAFGAFMLEVACGRRPLEQDGNDNRLVLVDWVLDSWRRGVIIDTIDSRLGGVYVMEEVELVLKLGLLCSHPLPEARPSTRQIMHYLEGDLPLPELSPTYMSFSMLALLQNEGFDAFGMLYPSMSATNTSSAMSSLSGGR